MKGIVLFDGVCNLCNGTVQFIIHHDGAGYFQFASLQSIAGARFIKEYGLTPNMNSVILIENGSYYEKSDAALRICRKLEGGWKLLAIFSIIPKPIRDFVYDRIAKNRYRWFGKKDSCMLPNTENHNRFLEK